MYIIRDEDYKFVKNVTDKIEVTDDLKEAIILKDIEPMLQLREYLKLIDIYSEFEICEINFTECEVKE
jgi:hypothetical protein